MTIWVWRNGLGVIPKDQAPPLSRDTRSVNVMRDQEGFVSPIDRTWVEGRQAVRDHERKHGVVQVGNDLSPHDLNAARRYGTGAHD